MRHQFNDKRTKTERERAYAHHELVEAGKLVRLDEVQQCPQLLNVVLRAQVDENEKEKEREKEK